MLPYARIGCGRPKVQINLEANHNKRVRREVLNTSCGRPKVQINLKANHNKRVRREVLNTSCGRPKVQINLKANHNGCYKGILANVAVEDLRYRLI